MKNIILLLAAFLLSDTLYAGGSGSHGGAGPVVNGRPMTFYTAGIYVSPIELSANEIPGMNEFLQIINDAKFLDTESVRRLVHAINPTAGRKYYRVLPETFTSETYNRLIAEYVRLTQLQPEEFTLHAITDTETNTTYLLPSFYRLQTIAEKQAILYHEGLWVTDHNALYKTIVDGEIKMQAYLENPHNPDRIMMLANHLDAFLKAKNRIRFKAAIVVDMANPSLQGVLIKKWSKRGSSTLRTTESRNRKGDIKEYYPFEVADDYTFIDFKQLFGAQFFQCFKDSSFRICKTHLAQHFLSMRRDYPESKFLDFLLEKATQDTIQLTALSRESWKGDYLCESNAGVNGGQNFFGGYHCNYGGFSLLLGDKTLGQYMEEGRLVLDKPNVFTNGQLGANFVMSPITSGYQIFVHFFKE